MAQGHNGAVTRFSGIEETKYKAWKFWAKAWLYKKRRYDDDYVLNNEGELAAELVTLLEPDSPAYLAVQHLENTIYDDGGLGLLWAALNGRFPEAAPMNQKGEALDGIFKIGPTKGEESGAYVGRTRTAFVRAAAPAIGLKFDEEVMGYILLRATRIKEDQQAVVLSLSNGDWHFDKIATAIRSAYPGKLPESGSRAGFWFNATGGGG